MPSPLRNKKYAWLVTQTVQDIYSIIGVSPTFRAAYRVATFEVEISEPNVSERTARLKTRKDGKVWVWNKKEFESEEEAMFSPVGRIAKIQKIPIKKA